MRILGIDPGTIKTGWGVIELDGSRLRHLGSGTLALGRGELSARLAGIYQGIVGVIDEHGPDEASIERNFLARNVKSAFRLGEGRGVAMAAAAGRGLPVAEYAPATIKKAVVGYGRADKHQVQEAVMRMLGLDDKPDEDAADALATALCHALSRSWDGKLAVALGAAGAGPR
jgi:crossover junction endodeoxyribonuclease RuvC